MSGLDFSQFEVIIGAVCGVLALIAWIVFKIIKKTVMLFIAGFLTLSAAGGAGYYWFWPPSL